MEHTNEHHLIYMRQIVTLELPSGAAIEADGQTGSNERYWCRIAWQGLSEIVECPDAWVEDRHEYKIRQAIREAIRRLQRRALPAR